MLSASGLRRTFGDKVAVNSVSFDVPDGRMVGFVGGNGAGKTTTMRMLMGVLEADEGEVLFDGQPVTAEQRAQIGYMPEERGLYPKQSLVSQIAYLGELKGLSRREAKSEASKQLERFDLGDRQDDLLESLSLGNQQRVQIVAAVIGEPIALILDEPFSGLDPTAIDEMAGVLRELTATGVPVLFSSHQLDLVDRLCDEIVVLAKGQVVAQGTVEELRETGPNRYRVATVGAADWVQTLFGDRVVDRDADGATVELHDNDAPEEFLRAAVEHGSVTEFTRIRPTLTDIYQEVTS